MLLLYNKVLVFVLLGPALTEQRGAMYHMLSEPSKLFEHIERQVQGCCAVTAHIM